MANLKKWTEKEDAELRSRWFAGESASIIAKAIGQGRSRNAIIGRLHRLGLCGRRKGLQRTYTKAPKPVHLITNRVVFNAAPRPKRVYEPKPRPAQTDEPQAIYTMTTDTGAGCRWICGDPRDLRFATVCGHEVHDRKWCAHHYARVYVAAPNNRLERLARVA